MSDEHGAGTYDPFTPCLIVVQRDASVIGKARICRVAHRWNGNPMDHIRDDLIEAVVDFPIPLRTVELSEPLTDDFYNETAPALCTHCFPERIEGDNDE